MTIRRSGGEPVAGLTALHEAIAEALRTGDDTDALSGVVAACLAVVPFDGGAMTVMASDTQRQTVSPLDETIAAFERAQYNLGEGPSLLAFSEGRMVLVPDLFEPSTAARWPGLVEEIRSLALGAVFCFPMRFGVIHLGVFVFYRRRAGELTAAEVALVLDVVDLTTLALLQLRGADRSQSLLERWLAVDAPSRRKVHQATGMVMRQLNVSAETAFARLRGAAFAGNVDIERLADDIVQRRLRLESDSH